MASGLVSVPASDDMLQAELQAFPPKHRPAISIYRELVAGHGADEVSYQMVGAYVGGGQ